MTITGSRRIQPHNSTINIHDLIKLAAGAVKRNPWIIWLTHPLKVCKLLLERVIFCYRCWLLPWILHQGSIILIISINIPLPFGLLLLFGLFNLFRRCHNADFAYVFFLWGKEDHLPVFWISKILILTLYLNKSHWLFVCRFWRPIIVHILQTNIPVRERVI